MSRVGRVPLTGLPAPWPLPRGPVPLVRPVRTWARGRSRPPDHAGVRPRPHVAGTVGRSYVAACGTACGSDPAPGRNRGRLSVRGGSAGDRPGRGRPFSKPPSLPRGSRAVSAPRAELVPQWLTGRQCVITRQLSVPLAPSESVPPSTQAVSSPMTDGPHSGPASPSRPGDRPGLTSAASESTCVTSGGVGHTVSPARGPTRLRPYYARALPGPRPAAAEPHGRPHQRGRPASSEPDPGPRHRHWGLLALAIEAGAAGGAAFTIPY